MKNNRVGVDLVYLPIHSRKNTLSLKRLNRLYHPSELNLFPRLNVEPEKAEAMAWSFKESAFKYFNAPRLFRPKDFHIQPLTNEGISVSYFNQEVLLHFNWYNAKTFVSQSKGSRTKILISRRISVEQQLKKLNPTYRLEHLPNGRPQLYENEVVSTKNISISHQGKYIAFALSE